MLLRTAVVPSPKVGREALPGRRLEIQVADRIEAPRRALEKIEQQCCELFVLVPEIWVAFQRDMMPPLVPACGGFVRRQTTMLSAKQSYGIFAKRWSIVLPARVRRRSLPASRKAVKREEGYRLAQRLLEPLMIARAGARTDRPLIIV